MSLGASSQVKSPAMPKSSPEYSQALPSPELLSELDEVPLLLELSLLLELNISGSDEFGDSSEQAKTAMEIAAANVKMVIFIVFSRY
jgi:hypothetical protein